VFGGSGRVVQDKKRQERRIVSKNIFFIIKGFIFAQDKVKD
jgi:hypothetical protein